MLATIGRYLDPWEAHIVRARLEAEGIPATVAGDRHMIVNWPLSLALGGAMLQVPEQFVDQARDVLASYNAGVYEQDLLEEYPDAADICPVCGSLRVSGSVPIRQRVLAVITTLVASAPFPARAARMRCLECGHRWRYTG